MPVTVSDIDMAYLDKQIYAGKPSEVNHEYCSIPS